MNKNEIIEKLNNCAESYAKTLAKGIPQVIKQIKAYYQLDDEDLCDIFGFSISDFLDLTDDTVYELHDLALLTLLSNGKFNLFNEAPNGEELNEINLLMKEYHDTKYPELEPEPELTRKDKLMKVLDLLGVKDDESLDTLLESLKDVNKIIDNFSLKDEEKCCKDECCCKKANNTAESKPERVYVDANGNFHSQKSYNASDSDTVKVKGAYYNSETMDDPQSFTIDLNKLLGTNITFDKVMNFLRNINKNLQ